MKKPNSKRNPKPPRRKAMTNVDVARIMVEVDVHRYSGGYQAIAVTKSERIPLCSYGGDNKQTASLGVHRVAAILDAADRIRSKK